MKIKKINNIISIVIIALLIILVFLVYGIVKSLKNEVKETAIIDTIENYHYQLTDNDTDYFKETFKELKNTLKEKNEEKYAELVSKLFIIDFYSLSSAINKNDVGGVQFIESSSRETFIKKAKDTIYKNVENNIYGDRIQDLPTVKEVNVENIKKQEKNNVTYYIVLANILYEKEMGYPTKIRLTLTYGEQTDLSNNHLEITKIEEISE